MRFLKNLKSKINGSLFSFRQKTKWSRKNYKEAPALFLKNVEMDVDYRILKLNKIYQAYFELHLNRENSLENYHLLDALDQFRKKTDWEVPLGKRVTDVGSKNFYYVRTLELFFQPETLTGIELDAYPLYRNFHTRASTAAHYIAPYPHAQFLAMDFLDYKTPCDIMTFFYPFVIEDPLINWNLSLNHFRPQDFFDHAYSLTPPGGFILVINQGDHEWVVAKEIISKAGYQLLHHLEMSHTLLERNFPPVVSLWQKTL